MFVGAIEIAGRFTRPIHTIVRYWDTTEVVPATATLFFVNDQGWALTCKHVAQLVLTAGIKERFAQLKAECAAAKKKSRQATHQIGQKYGYKKGVIIELQNLLVNCVDGLYPSLLSCYLSLLSCYLSLLADYSRAYSTPIVRGYSTKPSTLVG